MQLPFSHIESFNGSKLTEARMARALSQAQLGELSGVTKQSISNYENGKQTPRADSLEKLANFLNVPSAYFFSTEQQGDDSPIFFRSLASLHKLQRQSAAVKLTWLARILELYENYLELVSPNLPTHLDISDRYTTVDDNEIEQIAEECRRHFGIGAGPISNMAQLLENNGIILVHIPIEVKAEDAFSKWLFNSQFPVVVVVSETPTACRTRFSLAHELGHLVMHSKIQLTNANIKLIEEQANRFASAFLLPAHSYTRDFGYPNLDVFRILKERWKVSIQAQVVRCKQLGILDEQQAKRFFINISKRKWRTQEPLDDVIPVEKPKVLKDATMLLSNEGILTLEDIAHKTVLSIRDVSQLTGIEIARPTPLPKLKPAIDKPSNKNNIIQFPK